MGNRIIFMNGIEYDLTTIDVFVIQTALIHLSYDLQDIKEKVLIEPYLEHLKHLFCDFLD